MVLRTRAQSSTLRHIGPILSRLQLRVIKPWRLTRPNVGRSPVTPQIPEGSTIDPPVSVPIEKPTSPAAVAEPGPADEPLELRSVFHGFRVEPPNHTPPCASAPIESLATSTAPAAASR